MKAWKLILKRKIIVTTTKKKHPQQTNDLSQSQTDVLLES